MNSEEITEAIRRYNERLQQFGVTEQALGWGEKGRSKLRFEILLSLWDFNKTSILDFGCGFGDLYEYLLAKGFSQISYTGIDVNERFIAIAQERYQLPDASFLVSNLLEDQYSTKHDYILSSGVFNHKLSNNMHFIEKAFDKFNELSIKGFAVNFLSDKVAYSYDYTFHSNPAEILTLAYRYSNNIVLRNDYMPFEFTVFINKAIPVDKEFTVYANYLKYV